MKIRTGWIIEIENRKYTISGSISFRGKYKYYLTDENKKVLTIDRQTLLSGFADNSIKYISSIGAK